LSNEFIQERALYYQLFNSSLFIFQGFDVIEFGKNLKKYQFHLTPGPTKVEMRGILTPNQRKLSDVLTNLKIDYNQTKFVLRYPNGKSLENISYNDDSENYKLNNSGNSYVQYENKFMDIDKYRKKIKQIESKLGVSNVFKRVYSTRKKLLEDKKSDLEMEFKGISKETIFFEYSPLYSKLKELLSSTDGKNNNEIQLKIEELLHFS
jgi:hypothetical protein